MPFPEPVMLTPLLNALQGKGFTNTNTNTKHDYTILSITQTGLTDFRSRQPRRSYFRVCPLHGLCPICWCVGLFAVSGYGSALCRTVPAEPQTGWAGLGWVGSGGAELC